jgi:AAA+ ATPase superfamily predicted ATPase
LINPYLNRGMLRNEGDFFGREEEIHNIYMRITHKSPQSCSVVGERRIGKSSLLYHLSKKRGRFSNYLPPDHDELYCVFYDLQSERSITVQRFFGKLKQKTVQVLGDIAPALRNTRVQDECEEDIFEALVERASDDGCRLIFFFDEFESITQNQNFDEQFFSQLRHIAYTYNAAFVTSSQEDLSTLCHTDAIAQSPFFNIFTKVNLQLLKEKEALVLIQEPAKAQGVHFTDREIDLVLELAGCHPFFIQIACSHLFELKRSKGQATLSSADRDRIREDFLAEAIDHFDYSLKHLDDRERSVLRAIATSPVFDTVASGTVSEMGSLKRKGLVVDQDDNLSPFSLSFLEFLQSLSAIPNAEDGQIAIVTNDGERLVRDQEEGDYDGIVWHLIISLEKRLRLLLTQRSRDRWGENWEQHFEKRYPDMYQSWVEKQQKDIQAFQSYERADIIFDYAYLDELCKLVEDDWDFFREVFEFKPGQGKRNKQSLHQKLENIVRVRNPLAHGRPVPDTELRRAHVSCHDISKQIDTWELRTRKQ